MTTAEPARGVVALIGDLDPAERRQWAVALQDALPEEHLVAEPEEVRALSTSVDVAIVANPPHGSLSQLPGLRFVQSLWVGVDRLLTDPDLPPVPIARLVDPTMTASMTASVVAHVLHLHLQHHRYRIAQAHHRWEPLDQPPVHRRRVGVLGLGELGAAAARALAGLGFPVTGWGRTARTLDGITTHTGPDGLHQVLRTSDILVNLLPLTSDTRGILHAEALALLPPSACLVNVARGAHVDEDALLQALDGGHLQHAVLDVFQQEPLRADHRFWSHPSVTVLPHVAAPTTIDSASAVVAQNVRSFRRGHSPRHLVDRVRGY